MPVEQVLRRFAVARAVALVLPIHNGPRPDREGSYE
jgi:hypothetical protein